MASVLIVDDDFPNRYLLKKYLELQGINSIEAENGQRAIDMFMEHQPTFIFMDIEMPIMNGKESSKRIKEINPEVTIVAVTSLPQGNSIKPFDHYIEKPYNLSAIEHALLHCGFYGKSPRKPS